MQSNRTQSGGNQPGASVEVCMTSAEYPFPLSIQITLPVKFRDHAMDAGRYPVYSLFYDLIQLQEGRTQQLILGGDSFTKELNDA